MTGIFKAHYTLKGKDWVRCLEPDDLQVFIHIGLAAMEYGRKGGKARSLTACRDKNGRFTKPLEVLVLDKTKTPTL